MDLSVALLTLSSTSRLRLSPPTAIWSDFAITRMSKTGSYMGTCGFWSSGQAPYRHHRRSHRALDREGDVAGRLDILADEREVDTAIGNDLGPIGDMAGHELARDVGHRRHRHECLLEGLLDLILVKPVMIEDLGEYLVAGALPNGLLDEVARPVGPQHLITRWNTPITNGDFNLWASS